MSVDPIVAPQIRRIAGTLHVRGFAHPAPFRDESPAREKAEDSEVAGWHENSGQMDQKNAR